MTENRLAMPIDEGGDGPSLHDYLGILRQRFWVLVLVLVLVPAITLVVSSLQQPTYSSSALVLLSETSLTEGLAGIQTASVDPARAVQTEADLGHVAAVAALALKAVPVRGVTTTDFLNASSVSASATSDFLTFSVTNHQPALAQRLATAYARAFASYKQSLDTQAIRNAQNDAVQHLAQLGARGQTKSPLYQSLLKEERQLATLAAAQAPGAVVVQQATAAVKVAPRSLRNAALALALALVLGLFLVFLIEALDARARNARMIGHRLGLEQLGSLPAPPRKLSRANQLVMLAAPTSAGADSIRILRANLDSANAEPKARTIMFTSAGPGEGKSTTIANLAVALARGGRHVVLVDCDHRNPSLHRFFGLNERPGLIDVELGQAEIEGVLRPVRIPGSDGRRPRRNKIAPNPGRLDVVTAGTPLEDPDEVDAKGSLAGVMATLRVRADFVLIDAPPLMSVGDAIDLASDVDALVLVTRLNVLRRDALDELGRILWSSPATKLGFVVTGARNIPSGYRGYHYSAPKRRSIMSIAPTKIRSSQAPAD